jgi:hypothetical protein
MSTSRLIPAHPSNIFPLLEKTLGKSGERWGAVESERLNIEINQSDYIF